MPDDDVKKPRGRGDKFIGMTWPNRTHFRPVPYSPLHPGVTIVEVFAPSSRDSTKDGDLLGVLYPSAGGFTFVSKYLNTASTINVDPTPPQALVVRVKPDK